MKVIQVIPTYNESENLPDLVKTLLAQPIPGLELLIVDDNSPDGTGKVADELALTFPGKVNVLHRTAKEGLGKAYIQGFRQALDDGADVVGMMDADLSHPPDRLPAMLAALEEADVVIGSRYCQGGSFGRFLACLAKSAFRFRERLCPDHSRFAHQRRHWRLPLMAAVRFGSDSFPTNPFQRLCLHR